MITVKTYDAPAIDRAAILRYAGAKESTPELETLLDECLAEVEGKLTYKVCYDEFWITYEEFATDLYFTHTESRDLLKNLAGANAVLLFAATVGIEMDRLIAKYAKISPAKALMMEAIGTERVESLCDAFCAEHPGTAPRFSPGYGDLPLEIQKDIFAVLDCPRHIGVCLGETLLMTPQKSVTALVGLCK